MDSVYFSTPRGARGLPPGESKVCFLVVWQEGSPTVGPRQLRLEDEAARAWLLAQNTQPAWRARPWRRILQKHLCKPLADYLLAHDPAPGAVVRMSVQNGRPRPSP